MRIFVRHGYLLGGSGSNIYARQLSREWSPRRTGPDYCFTPEAVTLVERRGRAGLRIQSAFEIARFELRIP